MQVCSRGIAPFRKGKFISRLTSLSRGCMQAALHLQRTVSQGIIIKLSSQYLSQVMEYSSKLYNLNPIKIELPKQDYNILVDDFQNAFFKDFQIFIFMHWLFMSDKLWATLQAAPSLLPPPYPNHPLIHSIISGKNTLFDLYSYL